MMDIIRLKNMQAFMPDHGDYWIAATRHHSQFKLQDGNIYTLKMGYL